VGSHRKVSANDNILMELYADQFLGASSDESAETNTSH
jgi:hypothetical protein